MVPVQKQSKSRKRKRRSHHALRPAQYAPCRSCGNPKLSHVACGNCGLVTTKLQLKQSVAVADDE